MKLLKSLGLAPAQGATTLGLSAHAQDTVKVGVLHSLSGTMKGTFKAKTAAK